MQNWEKRLEHDRCVRNALAIVNGIDPSTIQDPPGCLRPSARYCDQVNTRKLIEARMLLGVARMALANASASVTEAYNYRTDRNSDIEDLVLSTQKMIDSLEFTLKAHGEGIVIK